MDGPYSEFADRCDWNLLKLFHRIVTSGGVTSASRVTGRKQPALSLALKRLESQLEVRLCHRGAQGFSLTPEGAQVAELCRQMHELAARTPDEIAAATRNVRGTVRIQLISNIVSQTLDAVIADYHREHPNVAIEVDVAPWEAIGRALMRGEIDMGVAPARFRLPELDYDLLFEEEHHVYCGRGHRLYGHSVGDPRELAEAEFVLTGDDEPDELTRYRLRYGIGTRVAGQSKHLEEVRRLVSLGVGLAFLPAPLCAPDVAAGRLWAVTRDVVRPTHKVYVITNPRKDRHLASRRLVATLRQRLAAKHTRLPGSIPDQSSS